MRPFSRWFFLHVHRTLFLCAGGGVRLLLAMCLYVAEIPGLGREFFSCSSSCRLFLCERGLRGGQCGVVREKRKLGSAGGEASLGCWRCFV